MIETEDKRMIYINVHDLKNKNGSLVANIKTE